VSFVLSFFFSRGATISWPADENEDAQLQPLLTLHCASSKIIFVRPCIIVAKTQSARPLDFVGALSTVLSRERARPAAGGVSFTGSLRCFCFAFSLLYFCRDYTDADAAFSISISSICSRASTTQPALT
jgi:hypothetical protein